MSARSEHTGATGVDEKHVVFSLGEEEYGLPVSQVLEIVQLQDLITVPHGKDFLMGLMDIRGTILPVINLQRRLGIVHEETGTAPSRAIVIDSAGYRLGLAVDRVFQVHAFPADAVDAGPTTIKSATNRYITGVGKKGEDFVILLDLAGLFSSQEVRALAGA